MNMRFDRLSLSNFMSFADCGITLSDNGFVRVTGENLSKEDNSKSNGSGKSALWEAISWCLTGTTIRGSKDVVRHGEDSCSVSIHFTADTDEYEITRSKDKNKSGLTILKNGEDVSGKGIRDTEELLSQYLPDLTPSLINSIIILGQGLPMRFTNNTPAGRKEVLERLSKSDFMIEDLKERVSKRKEILYAKLQERKNELIKLNTEFDLLDTRAGRLRLELDSIQAADIAALVEERSKLNARIKEAQTEIDAINSKYEVSTSQAAIDWANKKVEIVNHYNDKQMELTNGYNEEVAPTLTAIQKTETSIDYKTAEIKKTEVSH